MLGTDEKKLLRKFGSAEVLNVDGKEILRDEKLFLLDQYY